MGSLHIPTLCAQTGEFSCHNSPQFWSVEGEVGLRSGSPGGIFRVDMGTVTSGTLSHPDSIYTVVLQETLSDGRPSF